jgi:hypothetical protein
MDLLTKIYSLVRLKCESSYSSVTKTLRIEHCFPSIAYYLTYYFNPRGQIFPHQTAPHALVRRPCCPQAQGALVLSLMSQNGLEDYI